ncbi:MULTISPECIES: hypothetical protein [Spirosoma]|uniref:Uncharacterized protein n=1 Tax=Spirosoma sordidisoli TaxID=2502893 RepID=A0A4Q2UQ70_9BACT|nr:MULTISPECIES: hypothetical protein [Spirosoma]RYC69795.1 hypothetical protein EQG79_14465 [Spirosoma sordidisoli]
MTLTADQLTELESMAGFFFVPDEIAIVLGVDAVALEDALDDETSPAYRAYQRGKLKSKLELRKSILTLAKQGSGPAQTLAIRLLDDLEARQP